MAGLEGFVLHSVVVDGASVQVSYSDPAGATVHGVEVRTAAITLGPELEDHFNEVVDAALQLVAEWNGLRRAPGVASG